MFQGLIVLPRQNLKTRKSKTHSVHPRVLQLFRERFPRPTEIQEKAFPRVLSGDNVLIVAPTGFGKTEAALLPVLSKILTEKPRPISVLYITPLRALNRDIFERLFWWAERLGISASLRHGDTSQAERGKQTKKPPQILITTPETLQSMLPAKVLGKHLANVRWVIVDELHELLDSKRGSQLALALERLRLRANFQTIALSATIGDLETARNFLRLDTVVTLDKPRKMNISVEMPKPTPEDRKMAEKLELHPVIVARLRRMHELVEEHGAVLTFVNTRSMAELLSSRYAAWDKAHKISVHHSSLSKDVRVIAEKKFKDGRIKGLIATSSLELGIDIGRVDLVIQYMSPRQVTRLVQRIGRSGHSIEKEPKGIILANDEEDALEAGVIADFAKKGRLERIRIYEKPLDVLAHQLIGLSLDKGRVPIDLAFNLVRRAWPYKDLTWDEYLSVLRQLEEERLIWLDEETFKARRSAYKYYFSNLSTIPDERKIWVVNRLSGKTVAGLDEVFVSDHLYPGAVFITKGTPWRVIDITDREVIVEPATDFTAGIPDWVGEDIPVPKEVAINVSKSWGGNLPKSLDVGTSKEIEKFRKKLEFYPNSRELILEYVEGVTILHCPYGTLINQTLAQTISAYASLILGRTIAVRSDAYRISVDADYRLVKKALMETPPDSLEHFLASHLSRSGIFKNRFIHVARRFGLLGKEVDYTRLSMRRLIDAMVNSPVYEEAMKEVFHDKLDVDGARDLIKNIQQGKVKIKEWISSKPSKLASFLSASSGYFLAERPTEEIISIVKSRIMSEYVGLECLNCGHLLYKRIEDLPEELSCPVCGGKMLTLADAEENQRTRIANLIRAYGKKAIIALAGRGVGPETAARILRKMHKDLDSLIKDIIEAERTFARTHRFWG